MPPNFKPMQVDASVTAPGFIAEMLLQSQHGAIELLPALPKKWPSGTIAGIKARGNVTVALAWQDGHATHAVLRPAKNGRII